LLSRHNLLSLTSGESCVEKSDYYMFNIAHLEEH